MPQGPVRLKKQDEGSQCCVIFFLIIHQLINLAFLIVGTLLIVGAKFFLDNEEDYRLQTLREKMAESDPKMPQVMVKNGAAVVDRVMQNFLAKLMVYAGVVLIIAGILGLVLTALRAWVIQKLYICLQILEFISTSGLLIWILIDAEFFRSLFENAIKLALKEIATSFDPLAIFENAKFTLFSKDNYCCERFFPNDPDCIPGSTACLDVLRNYNLMYIVVFVMPVTMACCLCLINTVLNCAIARIERGRNNYLAVKVNSS